MSRYRLHMGMGGLLLVAAVLMYVSFRGDVSEPVFGGKDLSTHLEDLASSDYQVRDQAAASILAIGPQARPWLLQVLRSRESFINTLVARVGAQTGIYKPRPVNRTLLRERAAELLGHFAAKDPTTIPALIAALQEPDRTALAEVQRALRRNGPIAVPFLSEALSHRKPSVREHAAEVLADLGESGKAAVPALAAALKDRNEVVRCRAAVALGACGKNDSCTVPTLTAAMADKSPAVRMAAAESLGKCGVRALSAKVTLLDRLGDAHAGVRIAAARALWIITREASPILPTLITAMADADYGWQAPFVLADIGPAASSAIPALVRKMREEKVPRPLRTPPSAAIALGRIGGGAVPELVQLLSEEQSRIRTSSAIALGMIGSPASGAAQALIGLLKDPDQEVRQASALSLAAINPDAQEVVPVLRELARDDDIFLASSAASILRKIDPASAAEMGLE